MGNKNSRIISFETAVKTLGQPRTKLYEDGKSSLFCLPMSGLLFIHAFTFLLFRRPLVPQPSRDCAKLLRVSSSALAWCPVLGLTVMCTTTGMQPMSPEEFKRSILEHYPHMVCDPGLHCHVLPCGRNLLASIHNGCCLHPTGTHHCPHGVPGLQHLSHQSIGL